MDVRRRRCWYLPRRRSYCKMNQLFRFEDSIIAQDTGDISPNGANAVVNTAIRHQSAPHGFAG